MNGGSSIPNASHANMEALNTNNHYAGRPNDLLAYEAEEKARKEAGKSFSKWCDNKRNSEQEKAETERHSDWLKLETLLAPLVKKPSKAVENRPKKTSTAQWSNWKWMEIRALNSTGSIITLTFWNNSWKTE